MIEPGTVKLNEEFRLPKRPYESDQVFPSKRTKYEIFEIDEQYDSSTSDMDTESKCSSRSDTEESDNNSDIDDDSNISTDQSRYKPVAFNTTSIHQQPLSRHSKKLITQFKYLYNHSKRKVIEPTQCKNDNINQIKKLHWELRNTFNRSALFKEGYAVLSDESFPFYSLCYMVCIKRYFAVCES